MERRRASDSVTDFAVLPNSREKEATFGEALDDLDSSLLAEKNMQHAGEGPDTQDKALHVVRLSCLRRARRRHHRRICRASQFSFRLALENLGRSPSSCILCWPLEAFKSLNTQNQAGLLMALRRHHFEDMMAWC